MAKSFKPKMHFGGNAALAKRVKQGKRLDNDGLKTVVSVNGIEIPAEEINIESGNYEGGSIEQKQRQAAIALVIKELLNQRAQALDIKQEDEQARLDAVIDHDVDVMQADEDYCHTYYEKNKRRFYTEPLLEARHILLAAAPDDVELLNKQREQAERIIEALQKSPQDFDRYVQAYSECPSKDQGGYLGQITRGYTVPEFEEKIMGLPQGLSERPIETRYGWHVVDIVQKQDGQLLPYEAVKQRIADYLEARTQQQAFQQYVKLLISDADVKGIKIDQADSPLVQ